MRTTRVFGREYRSPGELARRQNEISSILRSQPDGAIGPRQLQELRAEFEALNEARHDLIRDAGRNPAAREESGPEPRDHDDGDPRGRQARSEALGAVDFYVERNVLAPAAADRLDALIRRDSGPHHASRYLLAVGDPAYRSAFGKLLAHPQDAHLRFSREEADAVRKATLIDEERALGVGTSGMPLPLTVDPSIIMTGAGALNPIRALAQVETISTLEWKGISSDGVTAAFSAEGTEVGDGTPTIAGPTIRAEKAQAFVPYSIEVGQDYASSSLESELTRLVLDAKETLEADKFLTGTGSDEPAGILGGASPGSLTTTQRVQTAAVATLAVDDLYSVREAVPARFAAASAWAAHPTALDAILRLVASADASEPQIMPEGRGGPLLGRQVAEWSALDAAVATGNDIAILGDFRTGFRIVDRVGMSVEVVQHLLGANQRPTGQRGLYAYRRVGSAVVAPNALRYLEVK